jgi:hypothetical protein
VSGPAVQRAAHGLGVEAAFGDDNRAASVGRRLLELRKALPEPGGRTRKLRR